MIAFHPNPEVWNLLQDGVLRGLRTSDLNGMMTIEVATFLSEWLLGCNDSVRLTLHNGVVRDFEMWETEAADFWEWVRASPRVVSADADEESKVIHIGFDIGILWLEYSDLEITTDRDFPLDIDDLRRVSRRFWNGSESRHVS